MIFMQIQKLFQYTIIATTLTTNWHVMSSESLRSSSVRDNVRSFYRNNISSFLHCVGDVTNKHPFASGLALASLPHLLPNTCLTNRWWVRPALGVALVFWARRYLDKYEKYQDCRTMLDNLDGRELQCSNHVCTLSILFHLTRPYVSPVVKSCFERMPFLTPRRILAGGLGGACGYAYYRHTHSQDGHDLTSSSSEISSFQQEQLKPSASSHSDNVQIVQQGYILGMGQHSC